MRTILAIDDDVLVTAEAMAQQQDRNLGEVISDLARRSLRRPQPGNSRNGIPLLPIRPSTSPVILGIVNALRDETP